MKSIETARSMAPTASRSAEEDEQMKRFNITFDSERKQYQYSEYRYDKLQDAINYAKLDKKRGGQRMAGNEFKPRVKYQRARGNTSLGCSQCGHVWNVNVAQCPFCGADYYKCSRCKRALSVREHEDKWCSNCKRSLW